MVGPTEDNPYQPPYKERPATAAAVPSVALKISRVFRYSYFTSLVVAFTVVPIWVMAMFLATPPEQRRTRPPDVLELMFIVVTTLPSLLTCLAFSAAYCLIFRTPDQPWLWPAMLFGTLSGLAFNAMTGITVIEYFFQW